MAVRLDNFTGGTDYYEGTVDIPFVSAGGDSITIGAAFVFNEAQSGMVLATEGTAGHSLLHRPRSTTAFRCTYNGVTTGAQVTSTTGVWSVGAAFQWSGGTFVDEDQCAPWWDETQDTLSAAANTAHSANYDTFTVGSMIGGGEKVGCDVAEVFVLQRQITATDMAMLAKGYSPLFFLGNGLVEYWPFHSTGNQVGWLNGWTLTENGAPVKAPHPRIIMPSSQEIFMPPAVVAAARASSMTLLGVG